MRAPRAAPSYSGLTFLKHPSASLRRSWCLIRRSPRSHSKLAFLSSSAANDASAPCAICDVPGRGEAPQAARTGAVSGRYRFLIINYSSLLGHLSMRAYNAVRDLKNVAPKFEFFWY